MSSAEVKAVQDLVDSWLSRTLAAGTLLTAVERDPGVQAGEHRWLVSVLGESKDTFTVWFNLRQRMLHYETYVMPAPEENHERFFEYLLRQNRQLVGASFCLGGEDAIYLVGAVPAATVDDRELDRLLGSLWDAVDRCFQSALRIGFTTRLGDR
ncbi:MAG: YbjN domain-containing protein [Acidimicrobiales bacterium]|jgi:hypothetical protein|nr:YbjN domain-containing protein [Acidimicrobiales bacterium]HJO80480.1 YbjN domain-containing protein [Acidimicrobiales bacterium]|tara:strand:- start:6963 stop:7424 length:462 start_codon:yes stop_codon:yes gene_type:complete